MAATPNAIDDCADGKAPPAGREVAFAVVDEGLLERASACP